VTTADILDNEGNTLKDRLAKMTDVFAIRI
jgi:hypothetical protein